MLHEGSTHLVQRSKNPCCTIDCSQITLIVIAELTCVHFEWVCTNLLFSWHHLHPPPICLSWVAPPPKIVHFRDVSLKSFYSAWLARVIREFSMTLTSLSWAFLLFACEPFIRFLCSLSNLFLTLSACALLLRSFSSMPSEMVTFVHCFRPFYVWTSELVKTIWKVLPSKASCVYFQILQQTGFAMRSARFIMRRGWKSSSVNRPRDSPTLNPGSRDQKFPAHAR